MCTENCPWNHSCNRSSPSSHHQININCGMFYWKRALFIETAMVSDQIILTTQKDIWLFMLWNFSLTCLTHVLCVTHFSCAFCIHKLALPCTADTGCPGSCITIVVWHCYKALSQWEHNFHRTLALPLAGRITTASGGRLNIKMSSYQYRDPHVIDKTVLRPFYRQHGNPIHRKDGPYIETGPRSLL